MQMSRCPVIPDVVPREPGHLPAPDHPSRQALLEAVKEKLLRIKSHKSAAPSAPEQQPAERRVRLYEFRHPDKLNRLQIRKLPSVTIATQAAPIQTDTAARQIRHVSTQADPQDQRQTMEQVTTATSPLVPTGGLEIWPQDVAQVVSDILQHELHDALVSFQHIPQQLLSKVSPFSFQTT